MASKVRHAEGYIEKRETPDGARYFAQVDSPFWYGELRETEEEAKADGRRHCEEAGLRVPCFGMPFPEGWANA